MGNRWSCRVIEQAKKVSKVVVGEGGRVGQVVEGECYKYIGLQHITFYLLSLLLYYVFLPLQNFKQCTAGCSLVVCLGKEQRI